MRPRRTSTSSSQVISRNNGVIRRVTTDCGIFGERADGVFDNSAGVYACSCVFFSGCVFFYSRVFFSGCVFINSGVFVCDCSVCSPDFDLIGIGSVRPDCGSRGGRGEA